MLLCKIETGCGDSRHGSRRVHTHGPQGDAHLTFLRVVNNDVGMLQTAAIIIITSGFLVFGLGVVGCCGACKQTKCLLALYVGAVALALVLTLAATSVALAYRTVVAEELLAKLRDSLITRYQGYITSDDQFSRAMDFAQVEFQCCGVNSWQDYNLTTNWTVRSSAVVPLTCCILDRDAYRKENFYVLQDMACARSPNSTNSNIDTKVVEGEWRNVRHAVRLTAVASLTPPPGHVDLMVWDMTVTRLRVLGSMWSYAQGSTNMCVQPNKEKYKLAYRLLSTSDKQCSSERQMKPKNQSCSTTSSANMQMILMTLRRFVRANPTDLTSSTCSYFQTVYDCTKEHRQVCSGNTDPLATVQTMKEIPLTTLSQSTIATTLTWRMSENFVNCSSMYSIQESQKECFRRENFTVEVPGVDARQTKRLLNDASPLDADNLQNACRTPRGYDGALECATEVTQKCLPLLASYIPTAKSTKMMYKELCSNISVIDFECLNSASSHLLQLAIQSKGLITDAVARPLLSQ
ncbi:hypothetical protein C0Q70_07983 [Pomacea canaliculata]|uniref:Uncharacterized protein n=1 Tax=Pomacea canaliculata TaxID=400727 RepID=A0A2T7PGK0_POMCA|nr:hypothetical protein C0Q70_07983 [Pomacea canaliculata]